jgi:hypothetical protein
MRALRAMRRINDGARRVAVGAHGMAAWVSRKRRDDVGGVSDETAMIGLMLLVAVAVAGIVMVLARGAAGRLDFGF